MPQFSYQFRRHTAFGIPERFPTSNLNNQPIDGYHCDVLKYADTMWVPLIDAIGNPLFVYPIRQPKTSGFGPRGYRFHYGTDFRLSVGDTIVAAMDGVVRICRDDKYGYGLFMVVAHPNGLETLYGHLSGYVAQEGEMVQAGQPIALGGNTGRSTGPHLHFEVRFMGVQFNPEHIMRLQDSSLACAELAICNQLFGHLRGAHSPRMQHAHPHAPASAGTPARLASARVHTVRRGETLGHLAQRYGTSVSRLCQLNRIRPTAVLRIGQRIRIS